MDEQYHNENGRFARGNPGKPKGSTKNKLRDQIRSFVSDNWKEFPAWFGKLKDKEKIETIIALLPYVVPRLQAVAFTDTEGNELQDAPLPFDFRKLKPETVKDLLKTYDESNNKAKV